MTAPILEVEDLVVEYGGRAALRAVDGVSLRIAPGEVLALVGESGCGKSSTARAVIGMEKPHSGVVSYRGGGVPALGLRTRPAEFTAMQMVFQDPNSSLSPRVRVAQQISDGARAARSRGVTAARLNGYGNFLTDFGEHLCLLRIGFFLFVLNIGPFAMS